MDLLQEDSLLGEIEWFVEYEADYEIKNVVYLFWELLDIVISYLYRDIFYHLFLFFILDLGRFWPFLFDKKFYLTINGPYGLF